jgi:hypothetical protein
MANRQYYVDQWLRRDAADAGMDVAAFEDAILAVFRSRSPNTVEFQSVGAMRDWIGTPRGASEYAGVMNRTAAIASAARRSEYGVSAELIADDETAYPRIAREQMLAIAERLYRSGDEWSAPSFRSR